MNKKLIFQLSLFGLIMGIATVFWISSSAEPFYWLIIFIICSYFVAKKCSRSYFFHGFLISMLNSIWITATHIIFFSQYIATHQEELEMMSKLPLPYSPRVAMLLTGPVFGAMFGIILGIFCVIASKIFPKEKQGVNS